MSGAGPGGGPAPSSRPTARVVIVNWRRPDLTIRACESIRPQLRDGDRLVVVDNASQDGSAAALRRAGLEVVETEQNLGFGAGVNAGATGLDEDVLVLLNNDAVAAPGFLDALTAPLGAGRDPSLAATTALILLAGRWRPARAEEAFLTGLDGSRWSRVPADAEARGEGEVLVNSTGNLVDPSGNGYDRDWLVRADRLDSPAEVFGLCGGACAIRRDVWEELGGLREDLFMYYEDTDLSWRIRESGRRVEFVAGAVARHEHAASSGADSPMFVRVNTRNRILVAAEHSPWPVLLRALARTAARAARHDLRGPVARGLRESVSELPRARRRRHRASEARLPSPATSGYCVSMSRAARISHLLRRGVTYIKTNGTRMTTARALQGLANRLATPAPAAGGPAQRSRSLTKTPLDMLVRFSDAAAVDWTTTPHWTNSPRPIPQDRAVRTAWIISPPGKSSGGHQNIFRFISFLEAAGHEARIYLYTASPIAVDVDNIRAMVRRSSSYVDVAASIEIYDSRRGVASDTDVIFATGWETAYPAYLDASDARRLYFIQDYEPFFYGVGSETKLAENTYRFGFQAITAGGWLAQKLNDEYGMITRSYNFGAELSTYPRTNDARREDLFFYARPVTTRRGFEFGVMVMQEVKSRRPDVTIHMAGWDVSSYDIPFEYVNHGALQISELPELYNSCAAALVMSLTNLSLLPLELLSCGTIPVVNDAPNNRLVSDNPFIAYAPLSPKVMADRLIEVLDDPDQVEHSRQAAASVATETWEHSGKQFVTAFEEILHG